MKVENWNGYEIRFVEKDGEWWAIAVDVTKALDIGNTTMALRRLETENKALISIEGISKGNEMVNIIDEFGIYDLVFSSHKAEAKEFKRWIFKIIKQLRQSSGLEGFQVFRMLDKEHQKEMMGKLKKGLRNPVRVNFIKANTITNKAVSTKYGFPKMVKKEEMTPEMLVDRQELLESTVELMGVKEKYHLNISVSDQIYEMAKEKSSSNCS